MQQKDFCPWATLCGYSFSSPGGSHSCSNDIKNREQTALIQSLFAVADQAEILIEQAALVLSRKSHNADFINDIPKLMSDLYLNYLRMAAIFHRLDTDTRITIKSPFILQARAIQADAGKALEYLDSLFDPHADYGEEDDDGDEETAGGISAEADEDDLCRITIDFDSLANYVCGLEDDELAIMRDAIEREARLRKEEVAQHS